MPGFGDGGLDPNDTGDGSGGELGGDAGISGGAGDGETGGDAPAPGGEAERAARARVTALAARVAELEEELEEAQRALSASERRRVIDGALADAGALDVETASLLVERAMSNGDSPDVTEIVRGLRRRKPHLFRMASAAGQSAMAEGAPDALLEAAAHAAEAGDRGSLLRYLRLRRMGG